ncbi:MAG: hypothetical protein JNL21_27650 [Myxococcales bacterium]|nr:hypothetical protein [Myxococcales bacterium]
MIITIPAGKNPIHLGRTYRLTASDKMVGRAYRHREVNTLDAGAVHTTDEDSGLQIAGSSLMPRLRALEAGGHITLSLTPAELLVEAG